MSETAVFWLHIWCKDNLTLQPTTAQRSQWSWRASTKVCWSERVKLKCHCLVCMRICVCSSLAFQREISLRSTVRGAQSQLGWGWCSVPAWQWWIVVFLFKTDDAGREVQVPMALLGAWLSFCSLISPAASALLGSTFPGWKCQCRAEGRAHPYVA